MQSIINALAAALEHESCEVHSEDNRIVLYFGTKNPSHYTHEGFCKELARDLAAAIAPLVEAGDVDDSQYTDDFLRWREKYFSKASPEIKQFVSKNTGVYFSYLELESKYERAMNGFNAKK